MRVITGTARGRRLKELSGQDTRPTTDRVKEGLFSSIQFDIEGRRALDLFAGTGQLGIEALSRGAASCVFLDMRKDAVALIRENLKITELEEHATVLQRDSLEFLANHQAQFDLIFLDPPYQTELLEKALGRIAEFDILSQHGIIAAECPVGKELPQQLGAVHLFRSYRYGKINVTVYHHD